MEKTGIASTRRVKAPDPSVEQLRELLDYSPVTGDFRWKVQCGPSAPGTRAGSVRADGYLDIQIGNFKHKAHRLAYAIHHGEMPPHGMLVDHIDGNGLNNRIENLRLATHSENQRNRQRLDKRNRTGITGVFWRADHQRWQVNIRVNRRTVYIGSYLNKEDAVEARRLAEVTHFGAFSPIRNRKRKLLAVVGVEETPVSRWPLIQGLLFQEVAQ